VDVKRSFTNTEGIEPSNLANILNTYAVVDPALDYCQGMNFIAGFLYLMFQDEAISFQVMRQIIKRFNISLLFNSETPRLKLMFYQLDRLISILVPDVHAHFKVSLPRRHLESNHNPLSEYRKSM
jgi:ecotropic viral integration site 5 protein